MTRDLLLLRSGKARAAHGEADSERPLKDRGKRSVQRIGVWLAGHGLVPRHVVAAATERARVSGQKALKAAGVGAGALQTDARLTNAGVVGQLAVLGDCGSLPGPVMLVLPGKSLRRLLRHVLAADETPSQLGSGSLVQLSLPDDWSRLGAGCARLVTVVRSQDLPQRFPFDGPDGPEWRDRPAYYYRQSAVIPYRRGASGLEILVIRSSKHTHWVVPKGIHDPGYSAQDSAAKEAEEEAGVLGDVHADPLGSFDLDKWGATCRVAVYPMHVTAILGESAWDESHRSRHWVTPAQAIARLRGEGLKRIVAAFAAQGPV